MSGIFHFQVSPEHIHRAQRFYKDVFNWSLLEETDSVDYMLLNSNNSDLSELKTRLQEQGDLFVTKIKVPNIEETAIKVQVYGGRILSSVTFNSKEKALYCEDSEGNILVIVEVI